MKSFEQALRDSFEWKDGYWSLALSDGWELTVEPLLFDEQHYIAMYDAKGQCVADKLVVKPGK